MKVGQRVSIDHGYRDGVVIEVRGDRVRVKIRDPHSGETYARWYKASEVSANR